MYNFGKYHLLLTYKTIFHIFINSYLKLILYFLVYLTMLYQLHNHIALNGSMVVNEEFRRM